MIRRPTPLAVAYAWHRKALRGDRPAYFDGDIHCGWYRRRLVQNGPWVPARIWLRQVVNHQGELEEPEEFICEINGKRRDPMQEFGWLASNPISQATFDEMVWKIEWAGQNDPTNSILQPHMPLPLSKRPTLPPVRRTA